VPRAPLMSSRSNICAAVAFCVMPFSMILQKSLQSMLSLRTPMASSTRASASVTVASLLSEPSATTSLPWLGPATRQQQSSVAAHLSAAAHVLCDMQQDRALQTCSSTETSPSPETSSQSKIWRRSRIC
jgi:hypothetical protein